MLTIRLQRAGKRNDPQYKLVLARSTTANQKQFVEALGSYNPHSKELQIRDQARLDYWIKEQHVHLSDTVHNLLVTKGLLEAPKVKAFTIPKKEVPAEETPTQEATSESAPAEAESSTESSEAPVETPAEAPAETTEAPAESAPVEEPAPITEETPAETPAEEPAKE